MTIRYFKGRQEFTFEISDGQNLTLKRKINGHSETFTYDREGSSIIQEELQWLAKNSTGIFRLLYLGLLPWSEILEVFVCLAEIEGITL